MRRIRPGQRHWQQDSEGGAAAVEFALVIPALLLIICGIFDFGNLYFQMDIDTGAILANGNITVNGAANISGSGQLFLYSATGNIIITGAENFGTGSSSVILYAPNGTISISGASNINEAIIANQVTLPGGASNVDGGFPITSLSLGSHAKLIS